MDHQGRVGRCPAAEYTDRLTIHARGQCLFLLGTIDCGIRGGIDDHVGLQAVEQGRQAGRCGQIGRFGMTTVGERAVTAGRDHLTPRSQAGVLEKCAAKLTIGTQQQDFHGRKTGRRSAATSSSMGARLSFSDSKGSLSGQSMPSAASFQRMPASALASYSAVH